MTAIKHNQVISPNYKNIKLKFQPFLRREYGFELDPDRPKCEFWATSQTCPNGKDCYNKHVSANFYKKVVCKHWLRGLCKKGEFCDFLHEYNLRKMPECLFFSQNGFCTQTPECIYLHIDPQTKIPECFNYKRGFCPDGPKCTKRHIRKTICELYLTGFCPYGPKCTLGSHPKFENLLSRLRIKPDKEILDALNREREEQTKKEDDSEIAASTDIGNNEKDAIDTNDQSQNKRKLEEDDMYQDSEDLDGTKNPSKKLKV